MAPTPTQLVWRARIERGLRVAAPALDLLLAAGDRLSRVLVPTDDTHVPSRSARTRGELGPSRPESAPR